MSQSNGEKKQRPPVKWLAPIQPNEKGSFGRPTLCAACRGNSDIGVILNYFLYEASVEAEREKIDTSQIEYIRLHRTLDAILMGIYPDAPSKKTLIGYHNKLEEWGFVRGNGYKHTYDVYFKNITEAILNPPPAEKKKPRGRHVSKVKTTISTISDLKTTIHEGGEENTEDCSIVEMEVLRSEIVELQSRMVKLQSEIVELQSRMVKLQSVQSSESASHLSPIRIFHAPRLLDCNRLIETKEREAMGDDCADDDDALSPSLSGNLVGLEDVVIHMALEDIRLYRNAQPVENHPQIVTSIPVPNTTSLPLTEATDRASVSGLGETLTPSEQSQILPAETQGQTSELFSIEMHGNAPKVQNEANIRIVDKVQTANETVEEEVTPEQTRPTVPQMPSASMKWSAEKMVQIVEAKNGKYYSDLSRPDQLKAGQKIMQKKISEEQFVSAYDERNDAWWKERKGKLHVIHMAARTERGQMRIIEVLDALESRGSKGGSTLKEQREDIQRKTALEAASRAKKNDEFYQELRRTRHEA